MFCRFQNAFTKILVISYIFQFQHKNVVQSPIAHVLSPVIFSQHLTDQDNPVSSNYLYSNTLICINHDIIFFLDNIKPSFLAIKAGCDTQNLVLNCLNTDVLHTFNFQRSNFRIQIHFYGDQCWLAWISDKFSL